MVDPPSSDSTTDRPMDVDVNVDEENMSSGMTPPESRLEPRDEHLPPPRLMITQIVCTATRKTNLDT